MRILYLTHRLPYAPNRGDRIRAFHMLREMSRFAEVSLFSLVHDDDEERRAADVPFARRVAVSRVTRARNLVRAAAALGTSRPLTHILLDAPDARQQLAAVAAEGRPDLVVAYCSGMARFAVEPPLADVPFVLDMVDVDSAKWARLAERSRGPRRWVYRRESLVLRAFEAAAAKRARVTMVVNDRELDVMRQISPAVPVSVISNGIDLDAFRPRGAAVTSSTVMFCGVMNYAPNEQGVRWFVSEVWPIVRAARPDARFQIVGASPTRAIRALASPADGIEVTGAVPEVQPYLWKAAVSVAPLFVAQGLQNKVLEALAAGVPVVVTPAAGAGLPNEARQGCLIATGAQEFANGVLTLLGLAPNERRRRAIAGDLTMLDWPARLASLEQTFRATNRQELHTS